MKKIDLNQAISLIANLGVLAGIIFLGLEIRQTNRAVAGSTYQARALALMERQDMLANSEFMAPILLKRNQGMGVEELDALERQRDYSTSLGVFLHIDGMHYQCELGLLDDEYCGSYIGAELALWIPRWQEYGIVESRRQRGLIRRGFDEAIRTHTEGD